MGKFDSSIYLPMLTGCILKLLPKEGQSCKMHSCCVGARQTSPGGRSYPINRSSRTLRKGDERLHGGSIHSLLDLSVTDYRRWLLLFS